MTPETRASFIIDYMDGELTDGLLCAKYGMTDQQLKVAVHIGTGSIIDPQPLNRGLKRGMRNSGAVEHLARATLQPEDMALSPLQSAEIKEGPIDQTARLDPEARNNALYLNDAELSFANNVLRGFNPVAAAAASFEIYNEHLARQKSAELLRSSHVAEYLASMRGRSLFAPVRNKAYLEAVLWQVIDRSLELKQKFNPLTGLAVEGVCEYNWKAAVAAGTLLAKIKGWDGSKDNATDTESQRDRLRRLAARTTKDTGNE